MKLIRKMTMLLLCVCLLVPCFSMVVSAATPGKIELSDVSCETNEVISVNTKLKVDAGVSTVKMILSYDEDKLEFMGAQNVEEVSPGELKYECELNKNSLYSGHSIGFPFKALEKGTTKIEIKEYDIKSSFDIEWTVGFATITIGSGVETQTDKKDNIEVENQDVIDDTKNEDVETDSEVNDNAKRVEIKISDITTIFLLDELIDIKLPKQYVETKISVEDIDYPAWQDTENTGIYILSAECLGEPLLYQYDSIEDTYQRFFIQKNDSTVDYDSKLQKFIDDNFKEVCIGIISLLAIVIIVVIVLGVKLYNRNVELDDVYEELDEKTAENKKLKRKYDNDEPYIESSTEKIMNRVGATVQKTMKQDEEDEFDVEFIDLDDDE